MKDPACFSALPGGNRNTDGSFNNLGSNGNWWTATENDATNAYNRNMNTGNTNVNENNNNKSNGFSARCLQDWSGGGRRFAASPLFLELRRAYLDARRNKRNTINQLKFERNLEYELLSLEQELQSRTYEIRPSVCFINELPVKREIIAADFRDRVIHHFLYNRIYPIFDRKFIYDCYSCRVGKGTLFGIKRARGFLRSCGSKSSAVWVLRLDIRGFFMAIDKNILFDLVIGGLGGRAGFSEDLSLDYYLIRKIIFNDPLESARFRSPSGAWDDLPKDKSLMFSPADCGLPIGNLTSQLFANVYLNPLDHFVKRELKIKYYGRYVDDMVLIHNDKQVLLDAISRIREYLSKELRLILHPRKIKLQPADKGFAFLGAYIYPNRVLAGRRVSRNFKACVFEPDPDFRRQNCRIQSYLGLLSHFDGTVKTIDGKGEKVSLLLGVR
jgi:retron-type reverse transcriptase